MSNWIGIMASGFAGGAVSAMANPSHRERVQNDPRWEQADRVRDQGREIQRQGQDHVDNCMAAAHDWRPFEAGREAAEAAQAALAADRAYREANRIEWEAAKDAAARGHESRLNQSCIIC